MQTRRIFLLKSIGAAVALPAATQTFAQTATKVDPKDAQALALGYVEDASKADAKKFPRWAKDQQCAGCQLFIKKGDDGAGACSIFSNKLVASKGWCSAWVKKA